MISRRYKNYKNFGKCLELSNGDVKALITVDVGPRIIFYGTKGANVMYEDVARSVSRGGEFFDKNFGEGEKWYIYGGHRLWKSPEDMESYVPDNYPVKVEKVEGGAIFLPRPQTLTGIQVTFKVTMDDDGSLTVEQSFTNIGDAETKVSLWGLTVLRQGGVEVIPVNDEDTGLLPNKNLVIWPYNDLKDKRFTFGNRYWLLKQNKKIERAFKIGFKSVHGWAAYAVGGNVVVKKFDIDDGELQDFGCNFETYTNNYILEMEGLSTARAIAAGETTTFTEKFYFYKGESFGGYTDEEIDATVKRLGI